MDCLDILRSNPCGGPKTVNHSGPTNKAVCDLDKIFQEYAVDYWDKLRTKEGLKQKIRDLKLVVDWNKLRVSQDETEYIDRDRSTLHKPFKNKERTHGLFRSVFTNATSLDQAFKFTAEQASKQTLAFSFDRSLSMEKQTNITLKLPNDIMELGASLSKEYTLGCGQNETKEGEATWGLDTTIHVKPHTRAIVDVNVKEVEAKRGFYTRIRYKGSLIFKLLDPRNEDKLVKQFEADILHIIKWAQKYATTSVNFCTIQWDEKSVKEDAVQTSVSGYVNIKLGVEQYLVIQEESI